MTDSDILAISVIFNIILVVHHWVMHKRYEALGHLFGKTIQLMGAIADGEAMPYRDREKNIRIKEIKHEKDKPSTTAV